MSSSLIGHESARKFLETELPPVTMLRGPRSVGKWTLAEYLLEAHKIYEVDTRKYKSLDVPSAREIVTFAQRAPVGNLKAILIDLDFTSLAALNTLLKVLEEPPSPVRFILTLSGSTLDTVMSRSRVFQLGLLSDAEVCAVLSSVFGVRRDIAERSALIGRGQVQSALDSSTSEESRDRVLNILRVLAAKDFRGLYDFFSAAPSQMDNGVSVVWSLDDEQMFLRWANECYTGRWSEFSPVLSCGLRRPQAERFLMLFGPTGVRRGTGFDLGRALPVRRAYTLFREYMRSAS